MELSTDTKNILGLQLPTDPRWVDLAAISIEAILTDHAYCEQKAATMGVTLIVKFSDHERLVDEVTPLESIGTPEPTGDERSAFVEAFLDIVLNYVPLALGDNWTHRNIAMRVTYGHSLTSCLRGCDGFGHAGVWYQ